MKSFYSFYNVQNFHLFFLDYFYKYFFLHILVSVKCIPYPIPSTNNPDPKADHTIQEKFGGQFNKIKNNEQYFFQNINNILAWFTDIIINMHIHFHFSKIVYLQFEYIFIIYGRDMYYRFSKYSIFIFMQNNMHRLR